MTTHCGKTAGDAQTETPPGAGVLRLGAGSRHTGRQGYPRGGIAGLQARESC